MKPISQTTLPAFKISNVDGSGSVQFRAQSNKIGWVHTKANKPGASFDIFFYDALGREMLRKVNCKTETDQFGELMNIDTHMGEDMEVVLENIEGAENIDLFLN